MREWRKTNRLSGEALRRANARSYANTYLGRGKLQRQDCETCGNTESEMHHPDYDRPLDVVWLCRPCHVALHAG